MTLYQPGNPPHTFYPPGYPLLLTPLFWIFAHGDGGWGGWQVVLLAAKVLSLVAAALSLVLSARYLRQRLEPGWPRLVPYTVALFVTATSTTFLDYAHWTLSEMPYLAVSLGALLLAESETRQGKVWLGATSLAIAGYLIRTAALPLCVAVVWAIWRRNGRRTGIAALLLVTAVVVGWSIRNTLVDPAAPGYLDQLFAVDPYAPARGAITLATLVERVFTNLKVYAAIEIPRLFWPAIRSSGQVQPAGVLLGTVLVPLVIYGFVRQVRRRGLRAGEVYLVLYLALLAIWPWNGDRFLLPLVPLIGSYIGSALADVTRAVWRNGREGAAVLERPATAVLLALALSAPNLWGAARGIPEQVRVTLRQLNGDHMAGYEVPVRNYFEAAAWLDANSPGDAIVVSRKPQFTYLFSQRKSILYPYAGPEEIERELRRAGADYVVFDRLGASATLYLRPYLLRYLDEYDMVHEIGDPATVVFARREP